MSAKIIPFGKARPRIEKEDFVPSLPSHQTSLYEGHPMCIERTNAFAKYPNILTRSAEYRLLWHYILFRANPNGLFWRSYQTISEETGLTRRSVYRLMGQMQSDGFLTKTGQSKHRTNVFFVIKPPVDNSVDNFGDRDRCVPAIGTRVALR